MNLYLISQDENEEYDTYDSAIVCAANEDEARNTKPDARPWGARFSSWCSSPDKVKVRLVGVAAEGVEPGVLLASFNAG